MFSSLEANIILSEYHSVLRFSNFQMQDRVTLTYNIILCLKFYTQPVQMIDILWKICPLLSVVRTVLPLSNIGFMAFYGSKFDAY